MTLRPYIALMRPKQWVKNGLIFAPAFCAGVLFVPDAFDSLFLAFAAFSLAASAVYAGNDLVDRHEDAKHPKKRERPLPSGRASPRLALLLLVILVVGSIFVASLVPGLLPVLAVYAVLNLAYSLALKRVAILDTVLVALFYVLRVVAGGVAAGVALSPWIVLATFFLALFLVAGKRRSEYERAGGERRKSLDGYARETLDALLAGSAALALSSYGLWSVLVHPSSYAVYTIIPVVAVLFRSLNLFYLKPEAGESPEMMVFRDPWILVLTALWGLGMLGLFYTA